MTGLRDVDANLILVLDAVLAEQDPQAAAQRVGLSVHALRVALTQLRVQLRDPVVEERAGRFEPTARARDLRPSVRDVMKQIDRTLEMTSATMAQGAGRRFFISVSDYGLMVLTSPLLRVLRDEVPDASIEFDVLPPAEPGTSPVDLLRHDVVIAGNDGGIPGKRRSLYSDSFVCIVDRQNTRLRDGRLSLGDLGALPLVMTGPRPPTGPPDPLTLLAKAGIAPRVALTVDGFTRVPMMVSGTDLVGFVPRRMAERFLDDLGLVIARTPLPSTTLVEAAHWHPSKTADAGLQWLLAVLRRAAEVVEFGDDA